MNEPSSAKPNFGMFAVAGAIVLLAMVIWKKSDHGSAPVVEPAPPVSTPQAAPIAVASPPPAPAPAPAPAVNPIVGTWKTSTPIGDFVLVLKEDGHAVMKYPFGDSNATYGLGDDGTLNIMPEGALAAGGMSKWKYSLNGNSMVTEEENGVRHIYLRVANQ